MKKGGASAFFYCCAGMVALVGAIHESPDIVHFRKCRNVLR